MYMKNMTILNLYTKYIIFIKLCINY